MTVMRLGTTSYIYPADILTNARKLAGTVRDIELVIFELDEKFNNLPDPDAIAQLKQIGSHHGMTYTVHLPLDLRLAEQNDPVSLQKAIRVIRSTRELFPHGFVVHLEGQTPFSASNARRWVENSAQSLNVLAEEAGGLEKLCVENLENQPPLMLDLILERIPVPCCADVGHLWKQGLDPLPHLERWLPRARVVHMHGIGKRDHEALSLVPESKLDPVVRLLSRRFEGVLTFEVFSLRNLEDCLDTFQKSVGRVRNRISQYSDCPK